MEKTLILLSALAVPIIAASCAEDSSGPGSSGSALAADDFTELEGETPPARLVEEARDAATRLGGHLISRLVEVSNRETPADAVRICGDEAQQAAAEHARPGFSVRRVSLRVRNPADEPDQYERRKLEQMAALHAKGELPGELIQVVSHEGRRELRYMRPLRVMDTCLACHGPREQMDPEVVKVLDERYPEDRATGYHAGDLRGAISVVVRLDEVSAES